QTSSESSKPTQTSGPVDTHNDSLAIAVISMTAATSQSSSLPASNLVENLAANWTTEDLSPASLTGHAHSVPLAAAATPTAKLPAPATPVGSVPQSPIGIATPAAPSAGP